ncbi:tetratricopeptide repeat protein [Draconibacterium sp. IB214405]|uniref:tetratricopeptide repeat protein n=1 Tax=Draconibacterium sp. IB214405 TaxID=3097352 RepID=UPI002A0EDFA9|nr:tetratricopeptide repeat protein [Draconibacterium sp. IB214405]MDX8341790.1 tetratricopeptide repeat protein [Draconibacterium sp. IB214405]
MYKGIFILVILSTILSGTSCQKQSKTIEPILDQAESILELNPDSALLLLHEITNVKRLKKEVYYQYYLLGLQAKYKSFKDITSDTLIFTIRDYYQNTNNPEKIALATFYCGRVYQEQKNYEEALQQYLETEQYLKNSTNFNLKGLCRSAIGNIYYRQLLKDKAISHFVAARDYFSQIEDYKNQVISSKLLGNCFLVLGKTDSAFLHYNNGLYLADKYNIKTEQIGIRMGLGVAYRELEDWKQSNYYFKEAMEFCTDSLNNAKLLTNIARVYELEGENDSAIVHLERALRHLPHEQNNSLVASIYDTWSGIEENKGNYKNALDKYKLFNKHLAEILAENRNKAVLDIEAKYNFQVIENKNRQLLIERQRFTLFALGVVFIFLLVILWFLKRVANREKELREAEQKIAQMKEMVRTFNEKEDTFRNVLIRHFDILKKAALLEKYLKRDERKKSERLLLKFNEVVYGQKNIDWNLLFEALNTASNGFFEKLRSRFTQLDKSEFRICCLAYADFNNTEIALILNYRVSSIEVKKSAIRKKMGIKTRGNLRDFLIQEVK